jgi:hypothetical protein
MTKMQKLFGCRKKCRQQEIQKKKIILHKLEDAGIWD